jgi:hypothetical protein
MALAVTGPPDSTYGSSDTHLSRGDRRDQRRYHRGRQPLRDTHDEYRVSVYRVGSCPRLALVGARWPAERLLR